MTLTGAGMILGAAIHPSVDPEAAAPSRWGDGGGGGWAHSEEEGSGPEGGQEEGGGGAPGRQRCLPAAITVFASGAPDHSAIRCEEVLLGKIAPNVHGATRVMQSKGWARLSTHYFPALVCMLYWCLCTAANVPELLLSRTYVGP